MKRILCFGDSNTWGVIPEPKKNPFPSLRYDEQTRWPCVLARDLGKNWRILEEGLGGRTTIYTVPGEAYRLASTYLEPCLLSHRPLDYVILMLGTNDIQPKFHKEALQPNRLNAGIHALLQIILSVPECGTGSVSPRILLLAPPPIRLSSSRPDVSAKYGMEAGVLLSHHFSSEYQKLCESFPAEFLNASLYAEASEADGIHFTRNSHVRLGHAVAKKIRNWERSAPEAPEISSEILRSSIEM